MFFSLTSCRGNGTSKVANLPVKDDDVNAFFQSYVNRVSFVRSIVDGHFQGSASILRAIVRQVVAAGIADARLREAQFDRRRRSSVESRPAAQKGLQRRFHQVQRFVDKGELILII